MPFSSDTEVIMLNTLKEMLNELKSFGYDLPKREQRKELNKLTNRTIARLLNDYCNESNYFEAVDVIGRDLDENIGGGYSPAGNYITLCNEYLDYMSIYSSFAGEYSSYTFMLEEAIDAYLHESRHAKQFADEMDICKVKYTDANEDIESYYEHPMEIDAREYAAEYLEDAIDYICEHLMDEIMPQIQSIISM